MANTIESKEFYNLMRSYRWASEYSASPASKAYQAVIAHIDESRAERDKRIVAATVEAIAVRMDGRIDKLSCEEWVGKSIRAITAESVLAGIDKKQEGAA